ncbi:MAG: NUDIX hydrolase [Deltaproteobacteria bacterium]|nr:MAG: NUDIX hydrolase [Deltaproteobacteria bacterium]
MAKVIRCPNCGTEVHIYHNPFPTVDVIIEEEGGVVLVKRKKDPRLWALPGGFCEYGESLEEAARREAREETGLEVELLEQFYSYSDPTRDPRQHNISTVFVARPKGGALRAGDDAEEVGIFTETSLPLPLAFDHERILRDYFRWKRTGQRPKPAKGPP